MSKGENETVILHMTGRVDQCRRLAKAINDAPARDALLKMAEEIEADMRRLASAPDGGGPAQD